MLKQVIRSLCAAFAVVLATGTAWADEPTQEPEQLPLPKQAAPFPAAPAFPVYEYPVVPSLPPRMDSRAGWAYFAPNSMGQMRPRVVVAPYGDYYLYNGEPYFGRTTRRPYTLPVTGEMSILPLSGGGR
jgi:hypothetical protein